MKSNEEQVGAAASDVGQAVGIPADSTIEQVRDLLFGGAQRSIERKLADLRAEMQSSMEQMRADYVSQLEALQGKVDELEYETEQKRRESLRDIGSAISELGAAISALGSGRAGK